MIEHLAPQGSRSVLLVVRGLHEDDGRRLVLGVMLALVAPTVGRWVARKLVENKVLPPRRKR